MLDKLVRVLDPTGSANTATIALAPAPTDVAGLRFGIRLDDTWPSFSVFSDELADVARRDWRVRDVRLFDPGTRSEAESIEAARLDSFVAQFDVAVVGLGT